MDKKKKVKAICIIFLTAFVLGLLMMPFRGYNYHVSSFVGFFTFYIYTLYALHRYEDRLPRWQITLWVLIGMGILEIPFRFISYDTTEGSLPDCVLRVLGLLFAYLSYGRKRVWGIGLLVIGLAANLFMSTSLFYPMTGWEIWLHRRNTGKFLPYAHQRALPAGLWSSAVNEQGESLETWRKGKVTLIDFWVKQCGVCWKKFPMVQQLYDRYKNHPDVTVASDYTVYDEGEDAATAVRLLQKRNYTFPVFSIAKTDPMLDTLGITTYPRIVLLDQEGRLVLNYANSSKELIEQEIEKLLEGAERR